MGTINVHSAKLGRLVLWEVKSPVKPQGILFEQVGGGGEIQIELKTKTPAWWPNVEYSTNGADWERFEQGVASPKAQKIWVRGKNPAGLSTGNASESFSETNKVYFDFGVSTGDLKISGNIMTLIDWENPPSEIPSPYCFSRLFSGQSGWGTNNFDGVDISDLELSATTLTAGCYRYMFRESKAINTVRELPAKDIPVAAYASLFEDCNIDDEGFLLKNIGFEDSVLGAYSCGAMFNQKAATINSFSRVPEGLLPAKELSQRCYMTMFKGCVMLEESPILPALSIKGGGSNGSYREMFNGCSNLSKITMMSLTAPNTGYTDSWVSGVASSGVFVKNKNATWADSFGANAIPTGWSVETIEPPI